MLTVHPCHSYGELQLVECLLTECHSDPNCATKHGETPLAMTYNTDVIRLLLQHGALANDVYKCIRAFASSQEVAKSTITVFMVGDKGAGKSTLTKALITEKLGIIRWTGRVSKVSDVKEKTAGIECHNVHSSRIGSLTIYDLAGHREFHNSHDTVIRSSISGPSSGMFLFVTDLGACLEDLKRTVTYWLSFIQGQVCINTSTQVSKPYLLAVGSHADLVKSSSALEEKQSAIRSLCETAENICFLDYVTVDCRYSESPSLNRLRSHILDTHDKLQSVTPEVTFHAHCFHIYLVSECGSKPGMKLGDLMKAIKSDPVSSKEKFLPQNMEELRDACTNIHKRGIMLFIPTRTVEGSWIIIDKDMLLREVYGSIFAPDDFTEHTELTRTGVVPFSKIRNTFEKLINEKESNPELIIDFLVHMEFCREMTEDDGLKLVTEIHPKYREERHFLFPALTPPNPPDNLWQPSPLISYSEYSSCWVLQCRGYQDYFSSRFHQVLLLRLAFTHAFPVEPDKVDTTSPALHQACTLWKNGIKWTTTSSVDALVEISDERVVFLLRCKKGKEFSLVKIRAQVITEILNAKVEFCSNTATVEKFIPNPQYTVDVKFAVSLIKLAHALSTHEEAILLTPHTPLDILDLLFFESYMFCNQQCLVDLHNKQLQSYKIIAPQFINYFACSMSHVDNFCTVLNVPLHKVAVGSSSSDYHKTVRMFQEWQSQSEGTYQCLRQQMDKYSVFSGRNILVGTHLFSTSVYMW